MVKIEQLLEAGVHFGHRVTKWNPRMAPFIFGERNGIHIIDLIQTLNYLDEASTFLEQFAGAGASRKQILFVGTKKQASSLIELCANTINGLVEGSDLVALEASGKNSGLLNEASFAHYVNHRWLGGLLTNWSTMKICIDQLNDLEKREALGELQTLPKKERSILKKQHEKLNKFFGGIKNMKQRPDVVIIVGQDVEMNAVRECNKLQNTGASHNFTPTNVVPSSLKGARTTGGNSSSAPARTKVNMSKSDGAPGKLRTITLLDTNCDPSLADIFIPANDDSTKSLELILGEFTTILSNARNS